MSEERYVLGKLYETSPPESKTVVLCAGVDVYEEKGTFQGVVVESEEEFPIGIFSTTWRNECFKPFDGKIVLECMKGDWQ